MEKLVLVLAVFWSGWMADTSTGAVPVSNKEISFNAVVDNAVEDGIVDDDFTTRGLERLSSAATCLVAGVEYTHGQQIYRADPCEFCLCLDGEMFCWWQDCPPTMEGPCRDRGPFSPCLPQREAPVAASLSSSSSSSSSSSASPSSSSSSSTTVKVSSAPQLSHETSPDTVTGVATSNEENSTDVSNFSVEAAEIEGSTETTSSITTTEDHKFCVVMDRKYKVGDKLPHDTGNCVECICGQGAKITCSPHQCAPAGEEINDYRPPGPRQQIPDSF